MRMLAETLDGHILNTVVGHDLKHRSLTPLSLSHTHRTAEGQAGDGAHAPLIVRCVPHLDALAYRKLIREVGATVRG